MSGIPVTHGASSLMPLASDIQASRHLAWCPWHSMSRHLVQLLGWHPGWMSQTAPEVDHMPWPRTAQSGRITETPRHKQPYPTHTNPPHLQLCKNLACRPTDVGGPVGHECATDRGATPSVVAIPRFCILGVSAQGLSSLTARGGCATLEGPAWHRAPPIRLGAPGHREVSAHGLRGPGKPDQWVASEASSWPTPHGLRLLGSSAKDELNTGHEVFGHWP